MAEAAPSFCVAFDLALVLALHAPRAESCMRVPVEEGRGRGMRALCLEVREIAEAIRPLRAIAPPDLAGA